MSNDLKLERSFIKLHKGTYSEFIEKYDLPTYYLNIKEDDDQKYEFELKYNDGELYIDVRRLNGCVAWQVTKKTITDVAKLRFFFKKQKSC